MIVDLAAVLILSALVILLLLCIINVIALDSIPVTEMTNASVKVSVLIPARNEEQNIENCVVSVLKQTYRHLEIIVLNDHSTDNTGAILSNISDAKLKVISGRELPEGWVGKNFACHQLQEVAKGDYLLFIDADTVLEKECVSSALEFAAKNNSDLLSVMPREISETFWEKLVIPMLYFAVTVFLPIPFIKRSANKIYAMGNGQFMMFRREFYDKIGGHESLKNKIVEDVWLARRVKEFGGNLVFADASNLISCRMYGNLNELWHGFSKNVFAGLSFSVTSLIVFIIIYFTLFVLPALFVTAGIWKFTAISAAIISIPVIMRIIQAIRFHQPFFYSFLNPLSVMFIIAVAINSFRLLRFGKGARWKGRNYSEEIISRS